MIPCAWKYVYASPTDDTSLYYIFPCDCARNSTNILDRLGYMRHTNNNDDIFNHQHDNCCGIVLGAYYF